MSRTGAAVKRLGRTAFLALLALVGCSSAALLYDGAAAPPSVPPPSLSATTSTRAPAVEAAPELVDFAPLGADPRFRTAAEALDAGDANRAGAELEAALESAPEARTPTVELWLGRIWERAGVPARALPLCEHAASLSFELEAYAGLCAARTRIALGHAKQALVGLETLEVPDAARLDRELLIAEATQVLGDRERAISALRGIVEVAGGEPPTEPSLALAGLLLERSAGEGDFEQALALARRVRASALPGRELARRAEQIELRALAALPAARRALLSVLSPEERLAQLNALLRARDYDAVELAATELLASLPAARRFERVGCEAELVLAKARSQARRSDIAVDGLKAARENCRADADLAARVWFVSGRYAMSADRDADAIGYFAEVEKRFPNDTLADDSRFYAAQCYLDIGAEDRFVELSSSLAERYPNGDMVAEGLFRLALRRMDRSAWSEALQLLDQGVSWVGSSDSSRGFDLVGRERYFRARALEALGKKAEARAELAELVRAFPLSYYMLQAYSRLNALDPAQAKEVLQNVRAASDSEPFRIARRHELDRTGFSRMLELLRIGELDAALKELDALGVSRSETAAEVLWGAALVYGRAGFTQLSADLAKRRLSDIARRWPTSGWEKAWQVAFPRPYSDIVQSEAKSNRVDPALVYAVMREESAFDPDAVSLANAYGLMQLIVPTAKTLAKRDKITVTPTTLRRPKVNVALGCRMLAQLSERFSDNALLAIPAYNAGPGRPARWVKERPSADFDLWVELVPFPETRRYTKRVLSSRAVYAFLYEAEAAESRLLLPLRVDGAGKI
jgi:soluble lytic murein transglycosylase